MKSVFIISMNTFREIIRDRILYGLVVFAILLISVSMLLGQLSFAEQVRISMNLGLTAIHLGTVILSVFVGSTLVRKEIDKKTIMTILARPISRGQFILGKALGLSLVNAVVMAGLSIVLAAVLHFLGAELNLVFVLALIGILLEGMLLLGITLFFSSFSTSIMVVTFTMGIFLIGHWLESMRCFAEKSESADFIAFQGVISRVFPDLEVFNWRAHAVYSDVVSASEAGFAGLYAIGWFSLMIVLTSLVLRKKDFA